MLLLLTLVRFHWLICDFMDWILLALGAYFLWGAGNVIEKLISKNIKEILSFGVLLGFTETLLLLTYFLFPITLPSISLLFLLFFAGSMRIIAFLPYVKALVKEEVTRLVPIWNTAPVFTFIMSYFLLSESFPPNFIAGFLLLFLGSMMLSIKKKITFKDGFYLMLLSTILYSIQIIILKYSSFSLELPSIIFWTAVGTFITTVLILFLSKKRKRIMDDLKSIPLKLVSPFAFFSLTALVLFVYAVWLGNSAIVTVLGGFQAVFLLVLGIIFKKQLGEFVDRKTILQKAAAIILMILGLAVLYLS